MRNMRRRDYRKVGFLGLLIFVMAFSFVFLAQRKLEDESTAASLAGFNAGYIISDYQMTDYNSMNEAEISIFLKSKGKCSNTNFGSVGTRVDYFSDTTPPTTWHVKDGHTVCLADEDNINGESIAHIIWQAAQDFRINPKVLIVLLQKETGIITDPIPNSWDYQRATGYGCPDTAACSEKYYGLRNQIRNAASLFRVVMDGNSSYYPIGNNYIQYNPNSACGGSVVNIQNLATSALYRYTPYQPNAGALAAGYGTATCGAYGNRNFYLYFEDWFGGINEDTVLDLPDSSTVVEGEYIIKSELRSDAVLDVYAGSSSNGANIQLYTNNNSDAQKWSITDTGDGSYAIKNVATGKSLDVEGGRIKNGTNVQSYTYNGSCAQKWHIVKNSDGTYTIYSVCSGRVLDVAYGSTNNGANIQIYQPNGSSAQKWTFVPTKILENGEYIISSVSSKNKVIDIAGGVANATNGTNIQIYTNNDSDAQKWRLTYNDGYYTILNSATNKVLDVLGAGTSSGTNVQLYSDNGSSAQKWQIVKTDIGYKIVSACSGLALNVVGDNVQIGDDSQVWNFEPVLAIEDGTYTIQSALNNNMAVDVFAGSSQNGANIQLYPSNGSSAQKWQIASTGDIYYSIKNSFSGKALDVAAGSTKDGANIQIYAFNDSCAQKWQIVKNDDETYSFYSMCSSKVLDVAFGNAHNGSNIQLYSYNGSNAQKWKLIKE